MFPLNTVIAQYKTYYELMEYANKHILFASRAHSQHIAICIYDHLYGAQGIRGSTSVDLSKGIVVLLPSLFLFLFLFFLFFGGLNGSLYLTLICPLWYLLNMSSLGSFPHLGATLYFTRRYRRSFTLYKSTQHKEDEAIMMYAN